MDKALFLSAASIAESKASIKFVALDEHLKKIVFEKARHLVKTGLWDITQMDDLCQTLTIIVWNALQNFDSLRSSKYTFADRVLSNRTKNMIDMEIRKKKGSPEQIISLDSVINDDGDTIADIIDADEYYCAIGNRCRSEFETMILRECVEYAISMLTPELQKICREIMAGETMSSLAEKYKISRIGFKKKYLMPIRKVFIAAGLNDFYGRA